MKLFISLRLQSTEEDEQESSGGEDNPVDEVGGGVWPGVKGHAVSTGTDTNAQRARRDQQQQHTGSLPALFSSAAVS